MDNSNSCWDTEAIGSTCSTIHEAMAAWDQLPVWNRRQNMYASFDVSPISELRNYWLALREGLSEKAMEQEWWAELLKAEQLIAEEIDRPVMGRRDGPIAEWSGLSTREARKGTHLRRGQP